MKILIGLLFSAGLLNPASAKLSPQMALSSQLFAKTPAGETVTLYTLRNSRGVEARIIDFGGTVISLKTPDKSGKLGDIVLGHDSLEGYLKDSPYFGALIGRYGNRIARGEFTLEGKTYTLARNNGENHLHGGLKGFDKVVWKSRAIERGGAPALELQYVSPDGQEGYPGTLTVKVVYQLTDEGLAIDYHAETDRPTVVNLTHHSYFNLAGKGSILDHQLQIRGSRFTPVDAGLIPTGELRAVQGTPFDFTSAQAIGARIAASDEQLQRGKGYDHNFVLDATGGKLALAARVVEPQSGRTLEVLTTEPGMQFYSGNFLDGTIVGKGGTKYAKNAGFCLETQHYPDSPNRAAFPSTVLRPGKAYESQTVYRFGVSP